MEKMLNGESINWDETLPKLVKEETFKTKPSNPGNAFVDTGYGSSFKRTKLHLTWNSLSVTLLPRLSGHKPNHLIVAVGLKQNSNGSQHFTVVTIVILKNPNILETKHVLNNRITAAWY